PASTTLFPYTTLFRSLRQIEGVKMCRPIPVAEAVRIHPRADEPVNVGRRLRPGIGPLGGQDEAPRRPEARDEALVGRHHGEDLRSEEHTSELQSRSDL